MAYPLPDGYVAMKIVNGPSSRQTFEFNVADRRGRLMGARLTSWEVDFTQMTPAEAAAHAETHYYVPNAPVDRAGHWYVFAPHATRDGVIYGASQPERYFRTSEERAKAAAKYLLEAEKRASKRAAAERGQSVGVITSTCPDCGRVGVGYCGCGA
ncbi:MAG TPA: hypothetical protein VLG10_08100 [Methylomirabilota bacterium]|nr:hypothetical protein [Methylomirabilota bacterium]